jgi:hypothetical protein
MLSCTEKLLSHLYEQRYVNYDAYAMLRSKITKCTRLRQAEHCNCAKYQNAVTKECKLRAAVLYMELITKVLTTGRVRFKYINGRLQNPCLNNDEIQLSLDDLKRIKGHVCYLCILHCNSGTQEQKNMLHSLFVNMDYRAFRAEYRRRVAAIVLSSLHVKKKIEASRQLYGQFDFREYVQCMQAYLPIDTPQYIFDTYDERLSLPTSLNGCSSSELGTSFIFNTDVKYQICGITPEQLCIPFEILGTHATLDSVLLHLEHTYDLAELLAVQKRLDASLERHSGLTLDDIGRELMHAEYSSFLRYLMRNMADYPQIFTRLALHVSEHIGLDNHIDKLVHIFFTEHVLYVHSSLTAIDRDIPKSYDSRHVSYPIATHVNTIQKLFYRRLDNW